MLSIHNNLSAGTQNVTGAYVIIMLLYRHLLTTHLHSKYVMVKNQQKLFVQGYNFKVPDAVTNYAKQKHLGCKKKCEANQKQHASRQVRPKALISAEAKKLVTLSKHF